jgi:2-hydroxychromene-2-carboxylate isomerase
MPAVDFYFDYASPWSYLADAIRARVVPSATFALRPVYLRGFARFNGGLPYAPQQLRYIGLDLLRCTRRWDVPLHFPSVFPVNGVHALRALLWTQRHAPERAEDLHARFFRAAWRDDRNVSTKEVVAELAAEAGVTPDLDDAPVKDELRAQTAAAQARGAFGVPSFFWGDELFFGHDRLDYLAAAVAASY